MVGMRTGPGCVKIRSGGVVGGCGEGVRVSSKLSRLHAPDLICGVRETQVKGTVHNFFIFGQISYFE